MNVACGYFSKHNSENKLNEELYRGITFSLKVNKNYLALTDKNIC